MVSKSRTTTGAVKHDRKKALKDYRERGFSMNLITNDCNDDNQDDVHSLIRGILTQSCSAGAKNFTKYVFCHPQFSGVI